MDATTVCDRDWVPYHQSRISALATVLHYYTLFEMNAEIVRYVLHISKRNGRRIETLMVAIER